MFRATVRPGVELQLLEERHAPVMFALADRERERLREWLPWVDATRTEEDLLAFIRKSLEQFAANEGFAAGIWVQGRFAGVIGTHRINWLNHKVELGYWLGSEFEGCGVMTDCCRAVVQHLFAELELNRVEIHCATGNSKSRAIPRRLGFALEGTEREAEYLNGRYVDLEVYAMLRREWKSITLPA